MQLDRLPTFSRRSAATVAALTAALVVVLLGGAILRGRANGSDVGQPAQATLPSPDGVRTPGPVGDTVEGLTTFRGNLTRSYYGEGPVPADPVIRWREPDRPMCMTSIVGLASSEWCGTGWTGQPNVIQQPDGTVEVREGAYDGRYHFVNGKTGAPLRPDLVTRDLAKGSATSDPDGYPLFYGGSRDNYLRVVALDRPQPTVLWEVNADISVPDPLRNNDWDGAPLVVGDYLIEGGENGYCYVIRLNRRYDAKGLVHVAPVIVATIQGWDDQLLRDLGDQEVSIENSVSFRNGVVYFANSGGLVQGWDISDLLAGGTSYHQVFRFWTGDDTDASVVIDQKGFLYVASEYQRFNDRAKQVGQLMKLDPSKPEDPLVWSIPARQIGFEGAGGSWSTPALYGGRVFFTTAAGHVLEVDRKSGKILYELQISAPAIGSPVVVDGVLIQGDCSGDLFAWNVESASEPPGLIWKRHFPGCIEATPAVWHGWLYLGTRQGYLYGLADRTTK
jgi:outer membrane protein assembly factor BamB